MKSRLFSLVFLAFIPKTVVAQVTPDSSLGAESSVVESNSNRDTIKGGAIRDANLFHSFQEFNVEALREAYFTNPDGIANIFSRVTGNNISDIQGVLGVLGNANLYLINPNGILFGENASLDVNGSFFATSADSVLFDNGFEFSAANPDAPPLLTIDIPIGLRFRDNPGALNLAGNLSVKPGHNLSLIGGNVNLNNGQIDSPSSNVYIGSVKEARVIDLNDNFTLNIPENSTRGNISLANESLVNVRADIGGNIFIDAGNLELTGASVIRNGIDSNSNPINSRAGDININATEKVTVKDGSQITNISRQGTIGSPGDINIVAGSFELSGSASYLDTSISGKGDAGDINITVTREDFLISSSDIYTNIFDSEAIGDGGNLNIIVVNGSLEIINSSFFTNNLAGRGDAGNINIVGKEVILNNSWLDGSTLSIGDGGNINLTADSINLDNTTLLTGVETEEGETQGIGNAGNITINVDSLFANNNSVISTATESLGNAGKIEIIARDKITFNNNSSIFTGVSLGGEGNSGDIEIKTNSFALTKNSSINSQSIGEGNGGNINIFAQDKISLDGSSTNITAGVDSSFDLVNRLELKNSGNINLETSYLKLSNGALISSINTSNLGNSGDINIIAKDAIVFDSSLTNNDLLPSIENITLTGIQNNTGELNQGNTGKINIETGSFRLSNAVVSSEIQGQGESGGITITVEDKLTLNNFATISSSLFGEGKAGDIIIQAKVLELNNGSEISTTALSSSVGDAGNITLSIAETITLDNGSRIFSDVLPGAKGSGGDINITTQLLSLNNFSSIDAEINGAGKAGAINIFATDKVEIRKNSSIVNAVGSRAIKGEGNFLTIDTPELIISHNGSISSSTSGEGDAGSITINAVDLVFLDGENSAIDSSVELGAVGNGGEVRVNTKNLFLTNGAFVSSETLSIGDAGSLKVYASDSIKLSGVSGNRRSGLFASATESSGNGGDLEILTNELIISDRATVSASNFSSIEGAGKPGTGEAGNVRIEANKITLENGSRINAATQAGDNGEITLKVTEDIILENNSFISAQAFKDATGGNLDIDARFIIAFPNQNNDIIASAEQGQGGNINITAEALFGIKERPLNPRTNDINASSEAGLDGSISIDTPTVDPTSGLLELTQEVVDPAKLIAQNVCTQTADSEFVDIGKGGLPQNPGDRLAGNAIDIELIDPIMVSSEEIKSITAITEFKPRINRKNPAQGWIFHKNGIVELVAYNPNRVGEQRTWENYRSCQ